MTITEFLRQSVIAVSDETLATTRYELDPYARRTVETTQVGRTSGEK